MTSINTFLTEIWAKFTSIFNPNLFSKLNFHINWQMAILCWLATFLGMLALALVLEKFIRKKRYRSSWYYMVYKLLDELETEIDTKSSSYVITELSKLLRIIAIKQFSRKCATLTGYEWLEWLTEHDPNRFSWVDKGKVLLGASDTDITEHEIQLAELIIAAKKWVNR